MFRFSFELPAIFSHQKWQAASKILLLAGCPSCERLMFGVRRLLGTPIWSSIKTRPTLLGSFLLWIETILLPVCAVVVPELPGSSINLGISSQFLWTLAPCLSRWILPLLLLDHAPFQRSGRYLPQHIVPVDCWHVSDEQVLVNLSVGIGDLRSCLNGAVDVPGLLLFLLAKVCRFPKIDRQSTVWSAVVVLQLLFARS